MSLIPNERTGTATNDTPARMARLRRAAALSVLALGAAAAATGCQQDRSRPARQQAVVEVEPLAMDEAIMARDWPPTVAYYAEGAVTAGPTRELFRVPHNVQGIARPLLEPVAFGGNVLYWPFSYIVQPPGTTQTFQGLEIEPTYTAVPPLPRDRTADRTGDGTQSPGIEGGADDIGDAPPAGSTPADATRTTPDAGGTDTGGTDTGGTDTGGTGTTPDGTAPDGTGETAPDAGGTSPNERGTILPEAGEQPDPVTSTPGSTDEPPDATEPRTPDAGAPGEGIDARPGVDPEPGATTPDAGDPGDVPDPGAGDAGAGGDPAVEGAGTGDPAVGGGEGDAGGGNVGGGGAGGAGGGGN